MILRRASRRLSASDPCRVEGSVIKVTTESEAQRRAVSSSSSSLRRCLELAMDPVPPCLRPSRRRHGPKAPRPGFCRDLHTEDLDFIVASWLSSRHQATRTCTLAHPRGPAVAHPWGSMRGRRMASRWRPAGPCCWQRTRGVRGRGGARAGAGGAEARARASCGRGPGEEASSAGPRAVARRPISFDGARSENCRSPR